MKKLLIVDVPDGGKMYAIRYSIQKGKKPASYWTSHFADYKELPLPTEEEIEKESNLKIPAVPYAFRAGANWYRNEILKQLK